MVQIDIEMPKNCSVCPLKVVEEDIVGEFYYHCPLIKTAIRGNKRHTRRFRNCPLKEVIEDDGK